MKKEITGQYSYINASSQSNLANKYVHICVYIWINYFITKGNVFQECKIDIQKSVNGNQCIGRIKGERVWSFFRYSKNILSESTSIHKKTLKQVEKELPKPVKKSMNIYIYIIFDVKIKNAFLLTLGTRQRFLFFFLLFKLIPKFPRQLSRTRKENKYINLKERSKFSEFR